MRPPPAPRAAPRAPTPAARPRLCASRPPTAAAASTSQSPTQPQTYTTPPAAARAEATVRAFYAAWNAGDPDAAAATLAPTVSYWDTIYATPFEGRPAVRAYLAKASAVLGPSVAFVVDAVAPSPDGAAVGVKWHCELPDGTLLPNSRGASFYELDGESGLIVGARDLVEPAIKPGAATLNVLRAVLPLVRLAGGMKGEGGGDKAAAAAPPPPPLSLRLTPPAAAVWALYAGYVSAVFFSRALPGLPVLETPPDVLQEVLDESLNFFYVNPILHALHLSPFPDPARPPPSEALFNFVNAWSALFLPVMLADRRAAPLGRKNVVYLWLGIQFLTNVFFPPYLALRLMTEGVDEDGAVDAPSSSLPSWAPAVAAVCAVVGAASLPWALFARPEFGGLEERAAATAAMLTTNRATFAFALDGCLYAVWQAALLRGVGGGYRFVPFFGLAAYLWRGGRRA